jgi:hypothetical protein
VTRKHTFVQNVRVKPFRLAFSTSARSLEYCVPQPSQARLTIAAADRHAREQYRGMPGVSRHRVDLGRVNTVSQCPQEIGTLVGNEESFPGAHVSGSDVTPAVDVDAVVGRATDGSAGAGPDFDERPVVDCPRCDDGPPFGAFRLMVVGKNSGEWCSRPVDFVDADIPVFCQNSDIPTQTIHRFAGNPAFNSDAYHSAACGGLPFVGGA